MVASKQTTMADRRALLTEREREIIAGDADVSDPYRYQTISRVRARFDRLDEDLKALEAHGELAGELRERVCLTERAPADEQTPSGRRERGVTPSEDTADQHPGGMTDEREGATAPADVDSFEFNRDLNDARREQLVAWLNHAAAESEGVQLSDFKNWWTDDRAAETGYNAGSFWEAFAKAAMKQADEFQKPDARTYRYADAAADQDQDQDADTDPLDESGPYDPTDEFDA